MAGMSRGELQRGRALYAQAAWVEAYESLACADRDEPLAAEDLELFATVAYMLGRDDEQLSALERAHRGYLHQGEGLRAVRCDRPRSIPGVVSCWVSPLTSSLLRFE